MLITPCPLGYEEIKTPLSGQRAYMRRLDGLRIIVTEEEEVDVRSWRHLSLSFPDMIPGFEDVASVKRAFVGEYHYAAMVFPPKKYYVNQHPYVLHIFACMKGDWPLPEFTRGQGTL